MSSLLTYIIVTWNSAQEIIPCLDSIKTHTSVPYDIIIVDNNSEDNTVEIIREQFPDITLIASDENLGFAKANNLALEHTKTDYLCYLNPDTILIEDIASPSIEKLKRDKSIGLISCQLLNVDGTHQPSCFAFANHKTLFGEILHLGKIMPAFLQQKYFTNYYKATTDFYPDWVIGAEMIMRTKDAVQIGGFSTDYFMYTEDMDICKKITQNLGKRILYLANTKLIHIGGASEAQNFNYNKQKKLFENTMQFVTKFYSSDEAKKTKKSMLVAYRLRLLILKLLYWKVNRQDVITKTQKSIGLLEVIEC